MFAPTGGGSGAGVEGAAVGGGAGLGAAGVGGDAAGVGTGGVPVRSAGTVLSESFFSMWTISSRSMTLTATFAAIRY